MAPVQIFKKKKAIFRFFVFDQYLCCVRFGRSSWRCCWYANPWTMTNQGQGQKQGCWDAPLLLLWSVVHLVALPWRLRRYQEQRCTRPLRNTYTHKHLSYYPCKDLLLIWLLMQLINVIRHLNLIRNIFFLCGFCIKTKKKISFPYGDPTSKFSDIHVLVRMFGLL